jgi:SET domain-containing protein
MSYEFIQLLIGCVTGGRSYCHATRWRETRRTTCLQISSKFLTYARVLEHYRDKRTVPVSHARGVNRIEHDGCQLTAHWL